MSSGRWFDWPIYLLVRIFICAVQAMRMETCIVAAKRLAWVLNDVLKVREETVHDNLISAFPRMTADERTVLSRDMWEHLLLLICEIAHAPRKIHDTNWRDYVTLTKSDILVRALLDDRPTVIVSGHYGNFELSGVLLGILGFPSYTIARPLDNVYLDRFLNRFRGAKGQHILPKDGSAKQIDALLSAGGTLVFLADQHAGSKGCNVTFFGRQALAHKAIALFSLCNDAPMCVCYSRRLGQPLHHLLGVYESYDPRDAESSLGSVPLLTQWYTHQLEEIIRGEPSQYWWLHRRWRGKKKAAEPQQAAA